MNIYPLALRYVYAAMVFRHWGVMELHGLWARVSIAIAKLQEGMFTELYMVYIYIYVIICNYIHDI